MLGTVAETRAIEHRVLVPPEIRGRLVEIAPAGPRRVADVVARIETARGVVPVSLFHRWRVRAARPAAERRQFSEPLVTGQRVLDTFFPLPRGGAAGMPGGFGTGKTVMQQQLCRWAWADVIVYVGCGERGNEMTHVLTELPKLTDPRTGRPLSERTVLVANTSNMPVAAREASLYTAVTMAEYYRDMGYHVAVLADSTSRWAEALREISGRLEEIPAEEGYPASLSSRLAAFYERAGLVATLGGSEGSVTLISAISPPGGDLTEPVTRHTRRFTRCFWTLEKRAGRSADLSGRLDRGLGRGRDGRDGGVVGPRGRPGLGPPAARRAGVPAGGRRHRAHGPAHRQRGAAREGTVPARDGASLRGWVPAPERLRSEGLVLLAATPGAPAPRLRRLAGAGLSAVARGVPAARLVDLPVARELASARSAFGEEELGRLEDLAAAIERAIAEVEASVTVPAAAAAVTP